MHILIATPAFPPFIGGGERHTGTLARHIVERGHTVTVFTSSATSEASFWQGCGHDIEADAENSKFTIIHAPIQPMPGGLRGLLAWRKCMVLLSELPGTLGLLQTMARRVPALMKVEEAMNMIEQPVDIVHGFNISWEHAMLAAWEYAREQTVPFVASPLAHLGTGPGDRVAKNSTMRHQRHMLSTADMLLTNTAIEARGLQDMGIDPAQVDVAGPGVNIPESVPTLPAAGLALKPYVLFVGRTSRDKGVFQAVRALLQLRDQGSDLQLVLIGLETEEFGHYIDRLPAADRQVIHSMGYVDEGLKHAYLKEAVALLLPSRTDSFGIVLLESWLYGRPVIAAAAGGIPAVVDEGQNGLLIPFGDVPALAGAIQLLAENQALNQELGQNGRQKLLAQYTWDAVTTKVLHAYVEVAQKE